MSLRYFPVTNDSVSEFDSSRAKLDASPFSDPAGSRWCHHVLPIWHLAVASAEISDSDGADSTLLLEEIRKVTTSMLRSRPEEGCCACLRGIWWSKDKRESSEHWLCWVLSNLFNLGCVGLQDVLDLRHNDLDDAFVEECFGLIENHVCSLDYINLNDNRITTEGALRLIRALEKWWNIDHRLPELLLLHRNPNWRLQQGWASSKRCRFSMWSWHSLDENGQAALTHKDLWSDCFAGPAQLLRTNILEQMERMPLAHDPRRTHSTMHSRLCSHLCGDRHRKNLRDFCVTLMKKISLSSSLCRRKFHSASSNWWSMLLWEVLASPWWAWPQTSPSREFRRPCLLGNARAGVSVWDLVPHSQAQEFPWAQSTKYERMRLWVMDVHYTQKAISKRFRDGRWLEELIRDFYMWNVDPCNHSNMCLEVVKYQEHFYNNDNRRPFCLRKHQQKLEETGWQVWVQARVFNFDHLLNRMRERWQEGTAPGDGIALDPTWSNMALAWWFQISKKKLMVKAWFDFSNILTFHGLLRMIFGRRVAEPPTTEVFDAFALCRGPWLKVIGLNLPNWTLQGPKDARTSKINFLSSHKQGNLSTNSM